MVGQYSIFDNAPRVKRKPCEYAFQRYIGQVVRDHRGTHVIKEIEPFYTIYTDNTCGTPHDMSPEDESEYMEMIETEIEYNEHLLMGKNDTNKSIARKNLEILRKLRR